MSQITLHCRINTANRFTLPPIEKTATLSELKLLISQNQNLEVTRIRLIYRGRILKNDEDTLEVAGLEDGGTVHVVVSAQTRSTNPAPAANTATIQQNPSPSNASTTANYNQNNMNPFAMGGGFGGMPGGMPNPEQMAQMANNPLFQNMLDQLSSNPEMFEQLITATNPQMREMLQNNPQLRHALTDPETIRNSLRAMSDPSAMAQMQRSMELQMSQIENMPGGFNAMRRMFEESGGLNAETPMMGGGLSSGSSSSNGASTENTGQSGAEGEAMPNPWGSFPSSGRSSLTNTQSTQGATGSDTNSMNPFMNNPFAATGAGFPGAGGAMNMEQMISMLENPTIRSMMESTLSNPALFNQMMQSNPMMQQMMQQNPAAATMMSDPNFMRSMLNPDNLRAMSQLQQAINPNGNAMFPGLPASGNANPWGGQTVGSSTTSSTNNSSGVTGNSGLDFSSLWNNNPNPATGTSAPFPNLFGVSSANTNYDSQIDQMIEMGFTDREANRRALEACGGNINRAVEWLLSRT